jgi:Protein of unknown function (DUF4197)
MPETCASLKAKFRFRFALDSPTVAVRLKSSFTFMKIKILPVLLGFSMLLPVPSPAGLFDGLTKSLFSSSSNNAALAALPSAQIGSGLKEALGKGVSNAVASLGCDGGFLKNADVKIPLPGTMQKIESGLRLAGQGQMVDEFVAAMNHAAEKAVPVAAGVFGDAIKQMSITDAKSILSGAPDAATQFFRRTSETNLHAQFLPLVKKATDAAGATARYKELTGKFAAVSALGSLFGAKTGGATSPLDVDSYVTSKAMDGLFKMVAAEEKNIRANPLARTSEVLKSVFGAAGK